ncbi:MAG: excinuclease ABC subunit UvrC [Planctomycetes bacterium]|nr:excinuclease ABC subunit UvrC [Planctomycetota bacterium]MCB9904291.1 excinuclease ABC subunit UvrC [Planctomycetota bacterium]
MTEPAWSMDDVPRRPGVYLFRDGAGKVLYVGKARDLRARLTSYRRPGGDGRILIRFLEREAQSVETVVTRTESEALLLEDALIKQHKPPHNVRLKDDKSFLMLRLDTAERFPRLKFVRAHSPKEGKQEGRSRFFGPYASSRAVRATLSDLHRVVPLRDCPDSVMNHRSRPCLKYQIGQCSAPCVDLISKEDYEELVQRAMRILSGDIGELEADLEQRMQRAALDLEYERAAQWRDRLKSLRRTVEGQGVRPRDRVSRDCLGLARRGDVAVVHRLAFRDGRLAESRTHRFRSELPDEELVHSVVTALYGGGRRKPPEELVLPCAPADQELLEAALDGGVKIVVPLGGDRKKALDVAGENAREALARLEKERLEGEGVLENLAKLLDLDESPEVIDCFDVSNFQGANVVASRVRFRRGIADRAGYRRFKVRGVEGQDDFASMREVVGRSLRRGVDEDDLPDLVVIDGGRAQLDSALAAREEAGAWSVAMVGLAKARAERVVKGKRKAQSEERLVLEGVETELALPRHSAVRHLFERIRDEAHRFAITYHRKERGRITSKLDGIPGVGAARRKALIQRFGSVAGVGAASLEEIAAVPGIGDALARTIRDHLERRDDGT